jgi:hypothetical protein
MSHTDSDPEHFGISPTQLSMPYHPLEWSNGSSFSSSASGSGAGGSFSSVDNLPQISRNFAPPSESDTRRPATAGGALQPSRNTFSTGLEATIQEEDGNDIQEGASAVSRRASVPHDSWLNHSQSIPTMTFQNQFFMAQPQQAQMNRNTVQVARPQTSDGLPHHTMVQTLPSLNSHVQYNNNMPARASLPQSAVPGMVYSNFPGDRTFSFADLSGQFVNPASGPSSYSGGDARKHTFVATDEDRPKAKRPRRRADEINRKYKCGWNGCDKGYGTLNHLNAHVETLKHGEKRTSEGKFICREMKRIADGLEFKWIKEQNKTAKQRAAAEAARNKTNRTIGERASFSSSTDSDYGRRDSAVSYSSMDYSSRGSINPSSSYDSMYGTRPGTANSMASFDGGSSSAGYPDQFAFGGQFNRRPSAPMHIPLPPPRPINQEFGLLNGNGNGNQFLNGDHLTPTTQYPHSHLNLGEYRPPAQGNGSSLHGNQGMDKPFEQFTFQR